MGYKSDIEIAQECQMLPITEIAAKAGISDEYLEQYGKYKAKIDYKPQEIFTYAWHDAYAYKGHARDQAVPDAPQAFEDARVLLEAPNGHTATVEFKGYTFLVMPQFTGAKGFLSWDEYEAKVAAATAL